MKVTEIAVFQTDLPVEGGDYEMSVSSHSTLDSTIVRLQTDQGITGYGEVTPLGSTYLPAFSRGARAGIKELASVILGADPTQPAVIADRLDSQLQGHPYAKSAIDMACWDITGKRFNVPVTDLLGGRYGDGVSLHRVISKDTPDKMATSAATYRNEGYDKFQAKIGEGPVIDAKRIRAVREELDSEHVLGADANTGLTQYEAIQLAKAVRNVDVYIEQPCATYGECRAVRRQMDHPLSLDEVVDGIHPIIRGYQEDVMDIINVKISKLGGLTRARVVRDLCTELGISMVIEDTWGSEIATSAIAHLAHSTPPDSRLATIDFHNYSSVMVAKGAPAIKNGQMVAPTEAGLGIEPQTEVLGEPVGVYE